MFKPFKIRDIEINPGLILAPMSGVTSSPFRQLVRELNPGAVGLVVTEFISVEALTRGGERSLSMMEYHPSERPIAIQIFGHDIKRMADAARLAQDRGADILDINSGCPAPKVVRKGGGCELMRQPLHMAKILAEVKRAIIIPLTLKIRSGWDQGSLNALEIARIAEREGVEALAVHGRSRAQLYRGDADWEIVELIANELSIPVIGSGDVLSQECALSRLQGRIAGVMIGRGALQNPLVFRDIVEGSSSQLREDPLLALSILTRYSELLAQRFWPNGCAGKLKQLASQMCRGHPWRKQLLESRTFDEQRALLSEIRLALVRETDSLDTRQSYASFEL